MKKNDPLTFFTKVILASVIFITAAKGACAQITLDWDVLTDTSPSEENASSLRSDTEKKSTILLKAPSSEVSKKNKKTSKKTKPAPKKTTKKEPPKPSEKYHVQETLQKDEHDKLKPHAAPVPQVKVLETNDTAEPAEKEILPEKTPEETAGPKISKHFLEQQSVEPPTPQQMQEEILPKKEPEQTEIAEVKPEIKEIAPEEKSLLLNFSVFPVSEKLSAAERSVVLSKELPPESATVKALTDKKTLQYILIFEKKSVELTEEMQNTLDGIASSMKKEKGRRLILYSYCSPDPAEPGKERQCALRRALKIRSYLPMCGIQSLRVELRSQGQKGAGDKIPDRTDIVIQDKSL